MGGFGNWLKGIVAQVNPFDGGKNFRTYNPKRRREDEDDRPRRVSSSPSRRTPSSPADYGGDIHSPNTSNMRQPRKTFDSGAVALRSPDTSPNNDLDGVFQGTPSVKPLKPEIKTNASETSRIPNYSAMSPEAQREALIKLRAKNLDTDAKARTIREAAKLDNKRDVAAIAASDPKAFTKAREQAQAQRKVNAENNMKTLGNIPVLGTAANWGTQLAGLYGKVTGNKELERRARNRSDLLTLGMSSKEIDQLDEKTKGKLGVLKAVVTGLGVLDGVGAASLAKAPLVGGVKAATKQGLKTEAGKQILKEATKATGKQYGKNVAAGALVGAGVDPAIQAYVKDGDIDWNSVPSSMLQGGLWAAAVPEFSGKGVVVSKLKSGTGLTAEETRALNDALKGMQPKTPTKIDVKQTRDISVQDTTPGASNIPVNKPGVQVGRPIVEVGGDTPGVNKVQVPTAADRFREQPIARPDRRVQGFTDEATGYGGGFTRREIMQEYDAIVDAHRKGELTGEQYRAAMDTIRKTIPVDTDPAGDFGRQKGAKIEVKEVRDIPVEDKTVVPVNTFEEPGTIRETAATAPAIEQSAALAARQPVALPEKTQEILDNPKNFTKRQVQSARNQRKLARQMARIQEDTSEALGRIEAHRPEPISNEGFVPTGSFSKGKRGNIREDMNMQLEREQAQVETSNMSPAAVMQEAAENKATNNAYTARDFRNIQALFDAKRVQRGTPEYDSLRMMLKDIGSQAGQMLRQQGQPMRRTASADQILGNYESRLYGLVDDPTKIDSKAFDKVEAATVDYTTKRDAAVQAHNRYTEAPTEANAQAYHAAQDAADAADSHAKRVEYEVASKTLKGNKDVKQARILDEMAQNADVYQMDAVDAAMLSGTGTFTRNFVNSAIGGVEEGIFGRPAAAIARATTGQSTGGGYGRGTIQGFKKGASNLVDVAKVRGANAGANPLEHVKNWATTGNQLGDTVIDAQAHRNTLAHYTHQLKSEGYTGKDLKVRAGVMARQDPGNIGAMYQSAARAASGLGSGMTRSNKIETFFKNLVSDAISAGHPTPQTEAVGKLVTRVTIGFPTAVMRSTVEGAKRTPLLGQLMDGVKIATTKDPVQRAIAVKEAVQHAGTGVAVIPPLFYGLGASGAITGAYPDDKAERERWEREGITENSIKIGNDYYQLPSYLGAWAAPGLFWAAIGRNNGDIELSMKETAKMIPEVVPIDGMNSLLDVLSGRKSFEKYAQQIVPSAVKASTPGGALLYQLAKTFDPTQNDTTSGTTIENIINKILNGIPGAANTLEDKTDSDGNVLKNPGAIPLMFGARSTDQAAGIEKTAEVQQEVDGVVAEMKEIGALSDPNLAKAITDPETMKLYKSIQDGKTIAPDKLKKVQEALVKGVSEEGKDTAYLERGEYDSHLAALRLKYSLLKADSTTKPSDLEDMETSIRRGELYRENHIPYELIKGYQTVGLEDWRKMGDPDHEDYDPERYEELLAIDMMMSEAGVSYAKKGKDKQKYYEKEKKGKGGGKGGGSGRGGRGGDNFSSDFGRLQAGIGAPKVQQYETISQQSGSVPVIRKERPNIVHKIGFSG